MRGIYLHVPFCLKKCAYCDFYSVAGPGGPAMDDFCRLLVRETEMFRDRYPDDAGAGADTVYFGGGTPTVLGTDRLASLLAAVAGRFRLARGAEVTVEANPGTVSPDGFRALRAGGFNRVSVGVQSFDPAALATLGRIHGADEARRACRAARAAAFDSVGIDLIFGIPGQAPAAWEADLEAAVALSPDHISAYALAPEPGTPIHAAIGRRELGMPPEDAVAQMYESAQRVLPRAGYPQYEISNFARPGMSCRHNLKYWRREGYLGFGPAAHGLLFPRGAPFGVRRSNPPSLEEYARALGEGRLPGAEAPPCGPDDAWKESLVAGLRLAAGVDLEAIERRCGPPPREVRGAVEDAVRSGRLIRDGSSLRLPPGLMFVSNEVLARLV